MTIYERIKERRKQLGISADEVADALNVSRATIYRYESAEIEKMPLTILEPLAKVLKTSPEYLMGWAEDNFPKEKITEEALKIFESLSEENQQFALEQLRLTANRLNKKDK